MYVCVIVFSDNLKLYFFVNYMHISLKDEYNNNDLFSQFSCGYNSRC